MMNLPTDVNLGIPRYLSAVGPMGLVLRCRGGGGLPPAAGLG